MEPLTLAASFSTLVSLIANFAAERKNEETSTYQDFTKWLLENHHEKVIGLLEQSAATTTSIKALLGYNHRAVLEKLSGLDDTLSRFASGIEDFRPIVNEVNPASLLSDQALSILEKFYDSGASKVLEGKYIKGSVVLHCRGGTKRSIDYSEPRYIEDDLATLVKMNLLLLEYNSTGGRVFQITREAEKFVRRVRATRSA